MVGALWDKTGFNYAKRDVATNLMVNELKKSGIRVDFGSSGSLTIIHCNEWRRGSPRDGKELTNIVS
jgi:hypothetical protein